MDRNGSKRYRKDNSYLSLDKKQRREETNEKKQREKKSRREKKKSGHNGAFVLLAMWIGLAESDPHWLSHYADT